MWTLIIELMTPQIERLLGDLLTQALEFHTDIAV
jgi:spore coat protein CotF